jgi:hypothetical protein
VQFYDYFLTIITSAVHTIRSQRSASFVSPSQENSALFWQSRVFTASQYDCGGRADDGYFTPLSVAVNGSMSDK